MTNAEVRREFFQAVCAVVACLFVLWSFGHFHRLRTEQKIDAICEAVQCEPEGDDG